MSNLALSRRLWRWLSLSKMPPSLIFFVVSISGNKFFIFALLWEAKFPRATIKDATRWWASELQRKIGSCTRFEELDTDIGTCSFIEVVVFVSRKVFFGHKLIRSRILLSFWRVFLHSCSWYRKVQIVKDSFSDLIYVPQIDFFQPFTACS